MTARDQKALFIGGSVIIAAVAVLRVFPALARTVVHAGAELHAQAELLARSRADLRELEPLRDSAASLSRAVVALAPHLVAGASPPDAAAAVTAELSLAANRHHLKLVGTGSVEADTSAGRLHRVRVHARFEGDVRGLAEALRALASSDPALIVRELRVTASTRESDPHGPEVLAIECTVEGWYLK